MTKKLKKSWALVKGTIAFIRLIKDPKQLDKVIELSNELAEPTALRQIVDRASRESVTAKNSFSEQPRVDLNLVLGNQTELLPNSLGAQYLKFLNDRNLDPHDLPIYRSNSHEQYVQAHLIETHDIWHIVCGFETDEAGELGLQAFYLAQLGTQLSSVLIGGGFLNSAFLAQEDTDNRMNEIIRGWKMGKSAKQLFGTDWNKYWNTPLEEIRSLHSIPQTTLSVSHSLN